MDNSLTVDDNSNYRSPPISKVININISELLPKYLTLLVKAKEGFDTNNFLNIQASWVGGISLITKLMT